MGISMKVCLLTVLFVAFCVANSVEGDNGINTKPYDEVLEFYDLSSEHSFTLSYLERFVHDFTDSISCSGKSQDNGNRSCSDNICLNISRLLSDYDGGNVSYISEQTFLNISVVLLNLAITSKETCYTVIDVGEEDFVSYKNNLIGRLRQSEDYDGLQVLRLQEVLESVEFDFDHDSDTVNTEHDENDDHNDDKDEDGDHHDDIDEDGDHHDDIDEDGDHHDDKDEDGDHHDDIHENDDHHNDKKLLLQEKCLGADVIFDELGMALDENISVANIGDIAGLIAYHIINGAKISRDCRLLPRKDFFFEELDHMYGNGNHTLGLRGLSEVMEALKIGVAHAQSETEEADHDHDHRRKRSADMSLMLYKASWEKTCYSDEQILAIFHEEDDDISEKTFSTICPALIQQKLSEACVSEEEASSNKNEPTTLEKYGYGSLATIIVCLCSAIGAFIVKFCSDKAYEVIMALFLGLAVGTLYTDSMIHLLPTALGIHGDHGEHDHGGSGIVVEDYVWFSLATCAALYFFYLFEKTLSLVRGQYIHSHGQNSLTEEKKHEIEMKISKGEKYQIDPMSKDVSVVKTEESIKSTSTVAVMVLMGDAVHNFADGVAIGAAFSSSLVLGLSTSIAVFCHELPHELGDFAILLASGVPFVRALLLNVLVSITAMIGLYVGLAISDDELIKQWIVAIAAGLFIYISLVDMMPQLLQRSKHGRRDFLLNNVGILLGAGAMLLLAIFEEKIKVSL